jgi:molybdopterin molybdotransferase
VGPVEELRISTGAKLPDGADAVVRQEDVEAGGDVATIVVPVVAGQNVRRAGEDMAAGSVVLQRGCALGPSELGVAASAGRSSVACVRRPLVHVITTGDELVEPGAPRHAAGVWNSTALTAPAQIRRAGGVPSLTARIPDQPEPTRDAIRDGLAADVLIVCGGVSVGPHDHVKPALDELGVEERFWRVALRPGMPTWFGVHDRDGRRTLVFGLPGNPVSTMVTFRLFVHPALLALQGADPSPRAAVGILAGDVRKREGRSEAVRCRALPTDDGWRLTVTGPQDSHVLTSMLGADALAILPAERSGLAAGERVPFELL